MRTPRLDVDIGAWNSQLVLTASNTTVWIYGELALDLVPNIVRY